MKPLFKYVIIKRDIEDLNKSVIIIPENANKNLLNTGIVYAIGKDVVEVKKGDKVIFDKYSSAEIDIEKEKYIFIKEENIIVIV